MLFSKDETEVKKVVTFYSIYTSIYFPLLLLILIWTDGIFSAGKYQFNTAVLVILIAEILKYFLSAIYFKTQDLTLSKKYEKNTGSIVRTALSKSKIKEGLKNIVVVLFTIFVFFAVAILYGAEVFSKHEETIMFSSLVSVLTVFPACINLGSHSVISLLLGSKPINNLEALIYQNFCMCVLGAWLGAFVIPLDWDRPWQVWPIPCSLGAMIGFLLSHFIMIFKVNVLSKKKIKRNV